MAFFLDEGNIYYDYDNGLEVGNMLKFIGWLVGFE